MKNLVLLWAFLLISFCTFPEGTKELNPKKDFGSLLLAKAGYTLFGQYGATDGEKIKIRIASPNERIYLGMNNRIGDQINDFIENVPFRIISPSGAIVLDSIMPNTGEPGNIATWEQAVMGPQQLGPAYAAGYDALILDPTETGDYVIEFDMTNISRSAIPANLNERLTIHLFDVTVADKTLQKPIPGRLHCQGWQISTESYGSPFYGKVYPYDPQGKAVYEVNLDNIVPFIFVTNFNSKGTKPVGSTSNGLVDRMSMEKDVSKPVVDNVFFPEYEVFLNPPDPAIYLTEENSLTLDSKIESASCERTRFCFTSNAGGSFEAFMDFNNNGKYDPADGEIYLDTVFTKGEKICFDRPNVDGKGRSFRNSNFKIISRLGDGLINLPLYDIEQNSRGYRVNRISPPSASSKPFWIFWDDSKLTQGNTENGEKLLNLEGCDASVNGCHRWSERGNPPTSSAGIQEIINTWWYSALDWDTLQYVGPTDPQVQLSFEPNFLLRKDTTICKGGNIKIYVNNDGKHFDPAVYRYDWSVNGNPYTPDLRSQKVEIQEYTQLAIKATDKSGTTCPVFDTLEVNAADPVKLQATVQEECEDNSGSIHVTLSTGPSGAVFHWTASPLNISFLTNLAKGDYHLKVEDPSVANCGADTVFIIKGEKRIKIKNLFSQPLNCNETGAGKARVYMNELRNNYQFSWDKGNFNSSDSMVNISAGKHGVLVRDAITGCKDSADFIIDFVKMRAGATSQNEICHNQKGSITLQLPSLPYLNIIWQGISGKQDRKTNLKEGTYPISVETGVAGCRFDTSIIIRNTDYTIAADFEIPSGVAAAIYAHKPIDFINLSRNASYAQWDFGDGQTAADYHASHVYNIQGEYTVKLYVQDKNGCKGDTLRVFKIGEEYRCGIALPNAFSPNKDGMNDDIGILGGAEKVDLKIFDRWGEVIFRTQDIALRWDGLYRGEEVPIGVYPYILEYQCPGSNDLLKQSSIVGDITLVR
jgi:gliding motility-associated-like protein